MSVQLSTGICARLFDFDPEDTDLLDTEHVVQLLSIKQVSPPNASGNTVDRYRIILSDGQNFLQSMLATQLNHLVRDEVIQKNSVIALEKITCNFVQEKRLTIILALRVIMKDAEKIGDPQSLAPGQNGAMDFAVSAPAVVISAAPTMQQPRVVPGGKSGRPSSVFPIEGLSPYQNNWTIKARVTQKSDIKTWSNQRGEGKLFNVTLMDESGEIRATGFNAVVDELYDRLQEGKVYFVSKARVNLAKKKFSNLTNDYELSLERNTEIEECHETTNVPTVKYNFVPLSNLEQVAKDSTCDVIGIIKEIGPLGEITTKTNRTIPKRELTLVDKSKYSVRLTLWGKQAEQYNVEDHPVIAFKGVKVGDFGGRSLSMFSSSTMSINPDVEEAHVLRGWYDSFGADEAFQSHSSSSGMMGSANTFSRDDVRNLNDVKEAGLGMGDQPEYFSTRATIMHIKQENIAYPACPTQGCNKKVVDTGDGWRCEKCDRVYEKPEYRYVLSMAVADWSGQAWLQGFNDAGLVVFGMPADDLVAIRNEDDTKYNTILQKATCSTFNFSCRAKQDTFNDTTRVRYGIMRILPLDYHEESVHIRNLLRSSWAQ